MNDLSTSWAAYSVISVLFSLPSITYLVFLCYEDNFGREFIFILKKTSYKTTVIGLQTENCLDENKSNPNQNCCQLRL
jgi:hypothetical protein